jgi:isoamylase
MPSASNTEPEQLRAAKAASKKSGPPGPLGAKHPIVRRMILDSLRYWVQEMNVDGFRIDLASILSSDGNGTPLPNPPVPWSAATPVSGKTYRADASSVVLLFAGGGTK